MNYAASIIICTRNRAESLRDTLASIGQCEVPADMPTELVVVDNGSVDHTSAVIGQSDLRNVHVRHILEPTAGQCYARNRGLTEASGKVIIFTDDDVRVPSHWVTGMCRLIVDGEADAVAGGVFFTRLRSEAVQMAPWWFASTEGIDPVTPDRMVGANMAFGRHVLERVPSFDVELGPGALGFHDETLFALQLLEAGYRLRGKLDVAVEHVFDLGRVTRKAILETAYRIGRCDAYLQHHWHHWDSDFTLTDVFHSSVGLALRRLYFWRDCFIRQRWTRWEIDRVHRAGFMKQYAVERLRSRNYAVRGTTKIAGKRWHAESSQREGLRQMVTLPRVVRQHVS